MSDAGRIGREGLEDRGDGGCGGLVACKHEGLDLAGPPVDADLAPGAQFVGPDEHDLVAGNRRRRPSGRGAAVTVADEDDVDLPAFGAHRANRVGAEGVSKLGGELAPRAVPVVALGEGGEPDLGERQHDLHPLVETGAAELAEVVTLEGHAREVGRESFDPGHLHSEAAVGGALALGGFGE